MGKLIVTLLSISLALGIVFAGHTESKAVLERTPASAIAVAPALLHSGTSDANSSGDRFGSVDARFNLAEPTESPVKYPAILDILITGLLCDGVQQPCWMRPAQYQRQVHGFARTGYGTQLTTSGGCKLVQQGGQPKLATPELLSGSLSSLSPPGLILRL